MRMPGMNALGLHHFMAALELIFADLKRDTAAGNVDMDQIPLFHQTNRPALGGFWRYMADG